MQQQYVTMLNDVLTAQQQQTLSQLVGQLSTFRPNTMRGPTGTTATGTNRNSGRHGLGRPVLNVGYDCAYVPNKRGQPEPTLPHLN